MLFALAACGGAQKPATWPVPSGWKTESFPFPLEFAPELKHQGVEELRFAPGMFEAGKPGFWSYAFVWRLDDDADLAPEALAAELRAYFAGLAKAVDADKHRFASYDDTHVTATPDGHGGFALTAHVLDAFATGAPVELAGVAVRHKCAHGSTWVFSFAPATTGMADPLNGLVSTAACGQTPVGK